MKEGSPGYPRSSIGQTIFSEDYLLDLAKTSGFLKRTPRKIDACGLLASICAECLNGSPSYNDLASSIEASRPDCGPSRQAVALRLDEPFETFIEHLLGDVIAHRLAGGDARPEALAERFCGYQKVLVQDSTVIKLPCHLFAEFSGVSNGQSSVCNARIQATYDLISSPDRCSRVAVKNDNGARVIVPGYWPNSNPTMNRRATFHCPSGTPRDSSA